MPSRSSTPGWKPRLPWAPTPEERQKGEREYLSREARDCGYLYSEGVDRVRAELTGVFVMLEAVETPVPRSGPTSHQCPSALRRWDCWSA